jgi:hypothetical protein
MSKTEPNQTSSIDLRVLGIIAALAIAYQFSTYQVQDEVFSFADGLYLLGIAVCAVSSFFVARRYHSSIVFGRAYLFLGSAFVSWFIGEILYFYYRFVLEIDAWPSPSDVFFIGSYVFASAHLLINSRYFKRNWSALMKIWLVACPIAITVIYLLIAAETWGQYEELPFDLLYSSFFVVGVSVELALAVIGASVFRHSILGTVWLLLVIGIFMWAVADIWFVYTEIFFEEDEQLPVSHPVNTLWMISFMVITYALIKHRKTI